MYGKDLRLVLLGSLLSGKLKFNSCSHTGFVFIFNYLILFVRKQAKPRAISRELKVVKK